MTTYTITAEQLASIKTARLELIDDGSFVAANALEWATDLQATPTLFLALHKGGEGYVSDERRDVDHAAGVLTISHPTTTACEFREAYDGEEVTVFEIARPAKES